MRFEVPQFIEVEDKIFGPLTWRQFVYLGGGVGWAVVTFLFLPKILFVFIGLPILVLSLALSFYPINNRPFSSFAESVFNYITGNRLYVWKQQNETVYKGEKSVTESPSNPVAPVRRTNTNTQNISSLARKLELQALQKSE